MKNYLRIEIPKDLEDYTRILETILIHSKSYIANYEDDDQFENEKITVVIAENDVGLQNAMAQYEDQDVYVNIIV